MSLWPSPREERDHLREGRGWPKEVCRSRFRPWPRRTGLGADGLGCVEAERAEEDQELHDRTSPVSADI